jgi:hypothetical protein
MQQWAHEFEHAVDSLSRASCSSPLPQQCFGRAQRLTPEKKPQSAVISRPSREGEVKIANSMSGAATRLWFRQLRRLQSLKHAVLANKQTSHALAYRDGLWQSIRRAAGFSPDFPAWWRTQTHAVQGTPEVLPWSAPTESAIVLAMYESFLCHFRAFESWHLQQRSSSLRMKYAGALNALYLDLRKDPRPGVEHLWKDVCYNILVDEEGHQLHVDQQIQQAGDFVWMHHDNFVDMTSCSGDVCSILSTERFSAGDELVQRFYFTNTNEILDAFAKHWQPRWSASAAISKEDWNRILQFAAAYMPRHQFDWQPLSIAMWRSTVKQFKPQAARGPDGFDKACRHAR